MPNTNRSSSPLPRVRPSGITPSIHLHKWIHLNVCLVSTGIQARGRSLELYSPARSEERGCHKKWFGEIQVRLLGFGEAGFIPKNHRRENGTVTCLR